MKKKKTIRVLTSEELVKAIKRMPKHSIIIYEDIEDRKIMTDEEHDKIMKEFNYHLEKLRRGLRLR